MTPDGIRDSGFGIRRESGSGIRISQSERIPNPKSQIPVLNAIVDVDVASRSKWRPVDLARAFLNGGARFLQLRAKSSGGAEFLDTTSSIVELAHAAGAIVIVNDRADIARLANADGVHVGQDDLVPALVRSLVGDEAVVGLSTHTLEQIDRAIEQPVSYLAIGPVFGTATKTTGYEAIGLARVREAAARARARGLPLVAIGGITLENAASAVGAGATSVAVISDLLSTGDPEQRTRDYLSRIGKGLT